MSDIGFMAEVEFFQPQMINKNVTTNLEKNKDKNAGGFDAGDFGVPADAGFADALDFGEKQLSPFDQKLKELDLNAMDEKKLLLTKEERAFVTRTGRLEKNVTQRDAEILKYNNDTKTLGSKSFKNNTEYKQKRNAYITESKALHKDATAYTLETYDKIKNALAQRQEERNASTLTAEERGKAIVARLMRVNFTIQMLYSTNIRNNLNLYLSYVYDYEELKSLKEAGGDFAGVEDRTLELFSQRIKLYCENNKIKLDGTLVETGQKQKKLEKEMLADWERAVKDSALEASSYAIDDEQITEQDLAQKTYEEGQEPYVINLDTLHSPKQRVQNVNRLVYSIKLIQERIEEIEQSGNHKKKYKKDAESQADYKEFVSEYALLNKQKALYTAYLNLAYAEHNYLSKKVEAKEPADGALSDECKEMYRQLRVIEESYDKYRFESFKKNVTVRKFETISSMSKGDAILLSDSVVKSDEKRQVLSTLSVRLENMEKDDMASTRDKKIVKALAKSLKKAFRHDRFYKGSKDEAETLKETMDLLQYRLTDKHKPEDERFLETIRDTYQQLDTLLRGGLSIPEGSEILDKRGQKPQNSGVNFKGKKRNAFLQSFSYCSDQKDMPLFCHEPAITDFKQNVITNCYLCSAVSSLTELSPSFIKDMMKDNGDGNVTVRLYDEEPGTEEMKPVYIRMDKTVPKIAGADYGSGGALWMQMIEKAIAFLGHKRSGGKTYGYRGLWYGAGFDILPVLTGVKSKQNVLDNPNVDSHIAFEEMMDWKNTGKIYTAGSKADATMVQPGHAYAIIGARVENGQRIIKLRNPYSRGATAYEYGTDAEKIAKQGHYGAMDFLGSETDDFGMFEMKYEDFLSQFATVWSNNLMR